MSFGDNLKKLRKLKKINQKELGKVLGIGQTTIANYESGNRFPNPAMLKEIAAYFDVSIDSLLSESGIDLDLLEIKNSPFDYDKLQKLFEAYLRNGDEVSASLLISSNTYSKDELVCIYEKVIRKTLIHVGKAWEDGIIDIATEHYISSIVFNIISNLTITNTHLLSPKETNEAAICVAFYAEHHTMGIRIVSDYLKLLGYKTYFVGNNTPIDSLIKMIIAIDAKLLAISVTMDYHIEGTQNMIKLLKSDERTSHLKIILGGQALQRNRHVINKLEADGYAENFNDLSTIINKFQRD